MLKLINVCKNFKYGKNKVTVLDNVNLDFKKHEMVFILGKSGSGKSTLLNIIGGLLHVDSGNIMLDDNDITKFNKKMLCYYRNNMVGFVFQNYHLIEYMSVIDNIKLGMTISGKSNDINKLLKKLGIYDKRNIKVNKLSGGEKQRVAIARAIINNPDIILCDEPTGALDSYNSINIMNILKEISRDKLVIVVSHDNNLANRYADRIININDGKVVYYPLVDNGVFKNIKKKRINLLSIIKLAIKNLSLKKGRTLFTSLAISIGFLSFLFVLCLSKSFNEDIIELEKDLVSIFPISIYDLEYQLVDSEIVSSDSKIIRKNDNNYFHKNKINNKYIDYINNIEEINYINYHYDISMPLISDRYKKLDNSYMKMFSCDSMFMNNYDLLYGDLPNNKNEIILKIDSNNNVDSDILDIFDINGDVEYRDIVGRNLKVIVNDLYYVRNGEFFYINNDNYEMYNNSDIVLEIVGVVREKEIVNDSSYFYYSRELFDYLINLNNNSEIVNIQIEKDYNVLGNDIDKYELLSYLGYGTLPMGIDLFVSNLDDKEEVILKLEEYNRVNDKIIYVDMMKDSIDIFRNFINIISLILVLFSFISICVSAMMIFILTNNRVMERIKEIGIFKSLGARNKDISKMFNAENFIIGIISSIIGIVIIYSLKEPINVVMSSLIDGEGIFKIYFDLVIISVIFNIFIVVFSGYIPTKIAGKREILDCFNDRC